MADTVIMLGEFIPCGGGDPIPLLKSKLLVGRRSRCDITLRFQNISSHHCELELINGYWRIRDLNSANGVKVNGDRCEKKWLMPGDIVSLGKHRFEVSYEPSGDAPPQEDEDVFARSLMEKAGLVKPKNSTGHIIAQLTERAEAKPANGESKGRNANSAKDGSPDDDAIQWLMDES